MDRKTFVSILEEYAPKKYAESWDNPGLLAGSLEGEVNKVLIALDATDYVVEEAVAGGYDFLVTHHPLIFKGIRSVTEETREGRRLLRLISHNIACFAMHTNCDVWRMAGKAAELLELSEVEPLSPLDAFPGEGIGRVGNLEEPVTVQALAKKVCEVFGIPFVRTAAAIGKQPEQCMEAEVQRIAVCPGSGHDFVEDAEARGAQVLITGDLSHHVVLDANADGLVVMDAGHFGTERFMKRQLLAYLTEEKQLDLEVALAEEIKPFVLVHRK